MNYHSAFFRTPDIVRAKEVILTGEGTSTPDERWQKETPWMFDAIAREMELRAGDLVLDYGCGIGRLARELCARGCNVIGVDISPEMRQMAYGYVNAPGRFFAYSPEEFDVLVNHGLQCDAAYAVWVLQHCENVQQDLERIFKAVKVRGKFFVANNLILRALPELTGDRFGWRRDDVNIWDMTARLFDVKNTIPYPHGLGLRPETYLCRSYNKNRGRI